MVGVIGAEHRQPLVPGIGGDAVAGRTAGLGHSQRVLRTAPLLVSVAVRVRHYEDGAGWERCPLVGRQVVGIEHGLGTHDQPCRRGIHHTVSAAIEHHHPVTDADHRSGVGYFEQFDGGQLGADTWVGDRLFVDHADVGLVDLGCAVCDRCREAGDHPVEEIGEHLWARCAEAIEGQVVAQPYAIGSQKARHRGDRAGVDRCGLDPIVERIEQVHDLGAAEG